MKDALFEATFVVLGVVLALAANEWREHALDKRAAARAHESIIEEIKLNQTAVQEAFDYHTGNLGEMTRRRQEGEEITIDVFSRGFLRSAQLSSVAWESASQTGALANMDYDTVLDLGRVYASQERYQAQSESTGAIIYRGIYEDGTLGILENAGGLANLISASAYNEEGLLKHYEAALVED